jgi:hypothetical protein
VTTLLTAITVTAVATILFVAAVLTRRRAVDRWLKHCEQARTSIVQKVEQARSEGRLEALRADLISDLEELQQQTDRLITRGGGPEAALSADHRLLGHWVAARLEAAQAALGASGERLCPEPRPAPTRHGDLIFLVVMAVSAFIGISSSLGAGGGTLGALGALGVWSVLRLIDSRGAARCARLQVALDELTLYCLVPVLDASQKTLNLDLMKRLGAAVGTTGQALRQLQQAIDSTPGTVVAMVESKLDSRTSISDALTRLSEQSQAMERALGQHATTIQAIPESLAGSVASEVAGGLEPACSSIDRLREELSTSYGAMSTALERTTVELLAVVRTMSDRDLFEDWARQMRSSVQAVAEMGRRLDTYFEDARTAAGALHKVAAAVEQTQSGIAGELEELARLNQLRGVDEKLHAEKIFGLFSGNLEKIEAEHREFRATVDEFIRKVEQDSAIRLALSNELPGVMSGLAEVKGSLQTLVDHAQDLPQRYAEVLHEIDHRSAANQEQLHQVLSETAQRFSEQYRDYQAKLMKRTGELVTSWTGIVEKANEVARTHIEAQGQMHGAQAEALGRHAEQMQQLFEKRQAELGSALDRLVRSQRSLQEDLLGSLRSSGEEYTTAFQEGLTELRGALHGLSTQAAAWEKIQADIAAGQSTLRETLTEALTRTVGDGMTQLRQEIGSYIHEADAQASATREQLSALAEQLKAQALTQAEHAEVLDRQITRTLTRIRRFTPAQLVSSTLLLAIAVLLLLQLLGSR